MVIYMEQQKVKQLLEKKGRTECYKIMYKMWLKEKTHQKYTRVKSHIICIVYNTWYETLNLHCVTELTLKCVLIFLSSVITQHVASV